MHAGRREEARVFLASYNIRYGYGTDGKEDLSRIAAEVSRADVICFQEVAQHWRRNDYADQAAELASRLNYYYVFGGNYDVDASYVDEGGRIVNRRRTFGNMVASRWPIRSSRTQPLPKRPAVDQFDMQRCAVEAVVETPGLHLRVYSVHLSHLSAERRRVQTEALLDFVNRAPEEGSAWDHTRPEDWTEGWPTPTLPQPAIIMGDLNFTAQNPEYALICGDQNARDTRGSGFHDAWVLAGNRAEEGVSARLREGDEFRRIDHAFVTADLMPAVGTAWIDNRTSGSDHYPLFVELTFDR